MGLGNGNPKHGDKGSNFNYELKNLKGTALTVGLLQSILIVLQDAKEDAEILLVRDEGNADLIVQQIRIYDTIADTWTTTYALLDGSPYVPVGPLVYLDSSSTLNQVIGQDNIAHAIANQYGFRVLGTDGLLDQQIKTDANGKIEIENLDVVLSTRLNTFGQKPSLTSAPVVLSTEQEAILQAIVTATGLGATEVTLLLTNGLLTTIDAVLDAIKVDTGNMLTSLATEATLLNVETAIDAMAANIDASTWDTTIGNTKVLAYYAGAGPGHPAATTSEVETIEFRNAGGATLIFTQTFTYDAANNVLTIVVT